MTKLKRLEFGVTVDESYGACDTESGPCLGFEDSDNCLTDAESFEDVLTSFDLRGFIDTHIHTAPDVKPRLLNDIEAAEDAQLNGMGAIVLKSHLEPTAGRAGIAEKATGFRVFGGVCLNKSVGGLNLDAVKTSARMGGKMVWLPTLSYTETFMDWEKLESIINTICEEDMVLATGHLKPQDIFHVIDMAGSAGLKRVLVNHPMTGVVGASLDEQKEMSRYAYLEHCFVACMPEHDCLAPAAIAEAVRHVGSSRCVMATDFGQKHNPAPSTGMRIFVKNMLEQGLSMEDVHTMCIKNPSKLLGSSPIKP